MQGISAQLTLLDSIMVPPSLAKFREHVPGYLESLCGPLLVFCSPKAEHKHPVEHQATRERVTQRLHEAIQASSTLSRILQHGCHPTGLQAKYQLGHILL